MISHPKNIHISNGRLERVLIHFFKRRENPLSKLIFFLSGCDFGVELHKSTFLPHPQGIVVGRVVRLGENVVIWNQVTPGGKDMELGNMSEVGDGVYLGAGAKVLGKIRIGNGATIGANAVVTKEVPPGAVVVGANLVLPRKKSAYAT